jgi:hypothetical protein
VRFRAPLTGKQSCPEPESNPDPEPVTGHSRGRSSQAEHDTTTIDHVPEVAAQVDLEIDDIYADFELPKNPGVSPHQSVTTTSVSTCTAIAPWKSPINP